MFYITPANTSAIIARFKGALKPALNEQNEHSIFSYMY